MRGQEEGGPRPRRTACYQLPGSLLGEHILSPVSRRGGSLSLSEAFHREQSLAAPMSPPGLIEEEEGCKGEPEHGPPHIHMHTVEASYSHSESRRARPYVEDPGQGSLESDCALPRAQPEKLSGEELSV